MIVTFHFIVFLVHEFFTPDWEKNVCDVAREVVAAMFEASSFDDDEVFYGDLVFS